MQISSSAIFEASPEAVYAMLTDRDFLLQVCQASGARSADARVAGSSTWMSRTLPAPEIAARFTGPTLTIIEEVTWGEPAADGARSGPVRLSVTGQPVRLAGTVVLRPTGDQTVLELNGDLEVDIPLIGDKLEKAAAPAVLSGIRVQQEVGSRWLSG